MGEIVWVGLGGAVGSMLRYGISRFPFTGVFPLLTLVTNLLGALLIGYLAGIAQVRRLPQEMVLFLKTGVCGGFTTFSTFSLEAMTMMQRENYIGAAAYILLSVAGCLAGVWCGMMAAH